MKAYHYNSLRFYDGETNCQKDPKASAAAGHDVFLIPANATDKKPTIKEGYAPRWTGEKWEQYANDKTVYGYTENADGTINYYGEAHTEEELKAKNPSVTLLFTQTAPVSVNGVYWLSADNPAYIAAKEAAEQESALSNLDADYTRQKAALIEQYTDSQIHGDTDTAAAIVDEMTSLDTWYDEEYEKILEG